MRAVRCFCWIVAAAGLVLTPAPGRGQGLASQCFSRIRGRERSGAIGIDCVEPLDCTVSPNEMDPDDIFRPGFCITISILAGDEPGATRYVDCSCVVARQNAISVEPSLRLADPALEVTLNAGLQNTTAGKFLILSGFVTDSSFPRDDIKGVPIMFSKPFLLTGTGTTRIRRGRVRSGALFLPSSNSPPVTVRLGHFLSGTVQGVFYREDTSDGQFIGGQFIVSVSDLAAPGSKGGSFFVGATLASKGLSGLVMRISTPMLFPTILAGSFRAQAFQGAANGVVP
jgi:hypothetical protein